VRLLPLFFVIIRARELRIKSCNELAELLADAVGGGAGRQAVNRADLTCKALTGHCRVFLEITGKKGQGKKGQASKLSSLSQLHLQLFHSLLEFGNTCRPLNRAS
jgi:hypothetical protein